MGWLKKLVAKGQGALKLLTILLVGLFHFHFIESTNSTACEQKQDASLIQSNEPSQIRVSIDVDPFLTDPLLRLVGVDAALPQNVAPSQLRAIRAEKILICLERSQRPTLPSDPYRPEDLVWSVAAKLHSPVTIAEFLGRWSNARIATPPKITLEMAGTIADVDYYRVPAGTFLSRPVRSGSLHFEDASGQRLHNGINVGSINPYYEYIGGSDQTRAIYTFDGVSEADLADGKLVLALRCPIFEAHFRDFQPVLLEGVVRNPKTGASSKPFQVSIASDEETLVTIPRIQGDASKSSLQTDLQKEFAVDGQMQFVFKLPEEAVYCGFGTHTVQLAYDRSEYLCMDNDLILLADSDERIRSMIKERTRLRDELASAKKTIEVSARFLDQEHAQSMRRFFDLECGYPAVAGLIKQTSEIKAYLDVSSGTQVGLTCRFWNVEAAENYTKTLLTEIVQWLTSLRRRSIEDIEHTAQGCRLVSYSLGGVPTAFSRNSIAMERWRELLNEWLGPVTVSPNCQLHGDRLQVSHSIPMPKFSNPDEKSEFLSRLHFVAGQAALEYSDPDRAENSLRLAHGYCPDDFGLHVSIGHTLAFNFSRKYQDAPRRYAAIRRGMDFVIQATETADNKADQLWLLSRMLRWNVGRRVYVPAEIAQRFQEDRELQESLRELARQVAQEDSSESDPNALTVQILDEAIRLREADGKSGSVPTLLLYSERAWAATSRAEFLTQTGGLTQAQDAWKQAARYFRQVALKPFLVIEEESYSLSDLEDFYEDQDAESQIVQQLAFAADQTECRHGMTMCEIATMPVMHEAFRQFRAARTSNLPLVETISQYEQAFERISGFTSYQEQIAVASLLEAEWEEYNSLRRRHGLPINDSVESFRAFRDLRGQDDLDRTKRIRAMIERGR